jgi:hypothetical protein
MEGIQYKASYIMFAKRLQWDCMEILWYMFMVMMPEGVEPPGGNPGSISPFERLWRQTYVSLFLSFGPTHPSITN